jgi:siroheme synthase-like protein
VADARSRNVWVNSATDPEAGDFALPAVAVRGRIRLAVSTGGGSPALAAHIRDILEQAIDDSLVAWVNLVAEIRREVRDVLPADRRRDLLLSLANPEWLDRIRADGPDAVRAAMRALADRESGR